MKMIVGALAATLLSSTSANAALLNVAVSTSNPFSFQIDEMPTVTGYTDSEFALRNIALSNGVIGEIVFKSASSRGGIEILNQRNDRPFFIGRGAQLYSGSEAIPTILKGTFLLSSGFVTISSVAAVPEPATWAMMLVGFGMMGGALRYRRRGTKVVHG
jgi:hypothetical protein